MGDGGGGGPGMSHRTYEQYTGEGMILHAQERHAAEVLQDRYEAAADAAHERARDRGLSD